MNETEATISDNHKSGVESVEDRGVLKENWVEEAIQREATPRELRKENQEEFCKRFNIDRTTYYRQMLRKENKRRIVEIWLNEALNGGQEVLKALQQKAKSGDTKAIELYMKFVLELAENLDVKSGGNTILIQVAREIANKYDLASNTTADSTG